MVIESIAWNIAVDRIIPPPKGGDSIVREIALKKKEGWYANTAYIGDEYSSYFIDEKVTHWMPLPEPPKEEKEEG